MPAQPQAPSNALFQPIAVGAWQLAHRVVMAPLTRMRNVDHVPGSLAVQYYGQRATKGGLIIAEGMAVTAMGDSYLRMPHMWTQEHANAWKPVVQAVHDKGGFIVAQLWHAGRVSHPDFLPDQQLPVSPSPIAVPPEYPVYTSKGEEMCPVPRELRQDELPAILEAHVQAARLALGAGFDGVEVHCANGYLLDCWIKSGTNKRTDAYGGSIENRCRFPLEVIRAVAAVAGADRTGVRFSPYNVFGAVDEGKYATFSYLMESLNPLGLAYVHMVEPRVPGNDTVVTPAAEYDHRQQKEALDGFRLAYRGTFMTAGGFTRQTGTEALSSGHADLIAYGRHFISNPDLVERFRLTAPLAEYDRNSFYTTHQTPLADMAKGYTDYPTLSQQQDTKPEGSSGCSRQHCKATGAAEGMPRAAKLGNAY